MGRAWKELCAGDGLCGDLEGSWVIVGFVYEMFVGERVVWGCGLMRDVGFGVCGEKDHIFTFS
jgi:hypothetical protein